LKNVSQDRADHFVGLIAGQDRTLMLSAWKEAMAFDSRPRLAEIACPTLVIAAADDQGVPIHHARMLHEGITGSELIIVEGAGHALLWTHPDELVRVVDRFLGV
jgi:pimeloyl-ACP methyl ester carboxylesterase